MRAAGASAVCVDLLHPPGLNEGFCKFLGEQRQAVRSRNDIGHELIGYALAPGSPLDDQLYQLTTKPVERQTRHVRMGCKVGRIFRPARDDHQDGRVRNALENDLQQFEGGWVHPMSIFQDEQRRLAASERKKLTVENLQCPISLLLRGQRQVGIRRRVRDIE